MFQKIYVPPENFKIKGFVSLTSSQGQSFRVWLGRCVGRDLFSARRYLLGPRYVNRDPEAETLRHSGQGVGEDLIVECSLL